MVGSRSTATRVTWGATSLSSSSHFPLVPNSSHTVKPVALPPGRDKLSTKPALTGSGICTNTIGTVRLACCSAATGPVPEAWMTSGARGDQFRRVSAAAVDIRCSEAVVDPDVTAVCPSQLLQPLQQRPHARLCLRIVLRQVHQHPNAPDAVRLL